MYRETVITFPSPQAATAAKRKLRAAGQHAWIESVDNTSESARKVTSTRVVVADHFAELGSIAQVLERIL